MISFLLKEAGLDIIEALRLSIQWLGCQARRHHDWREYVDEWEDGEIEVLIQCARCQTQG